MESARSWALFLSLAMLVSNPETSRIYNRGNKEVKTMTKNIYRHLAAAGISLGGLTALMLGIPNIQLFRHYDPRIGNMMLTYGVLLILITVGAVVMNILLYTKLKEQGSRIGLLFAILPIWLIEALSLLSIDYGAIGGNPTAIVTLVLTLLIIIAGSIGFNLMMRGRKIPGRILTSIFLAIVLIGTFMNFANANEMADEVKGLIIFGNVLRLFSIVLIGVLLYSNVKDEGDAPIMAEEAAPVVSEPAPAKRVETPVQPVAPAPEAPKPAEPKQSLREKLVEAKALYDDGLISEEEYAQIKKQAIENK